MRAKLHFVLSITIFFGSFYGLAQQDYWRPLTASTPKNINTRPSKEQLFVLEVNSFTAALLKCTKSTRSRMLFPNDEGTLEAYEVWETPVFHPDLAKKYPNIRSYTGVAIKGGAKIKFSVAPAGLQATILTFDGTPSSFIEAQSGAENTYRLHKGNTASKAFVCGTKNIALPQKSSAARNLATDQLLRRYRIAVSTTGEYASYHGGTVAGALGAINATLTRVNAVFEADLGVTLELVANNDAVVFTNAATDPYSGSFNAQVQNTLTSVIGEENYDVGHLFHRDNDNGNAGFIGSVCVDNRKGSAFASAQIPEGDAFDLDYVAHELGHQFGANHTWSFETEGTGVQVEPASGTTIMGYAGIVEGNNLAANGDDYFHHVSLVQIQDYLRTTSCSLNTNLSNNPPIITPQPDYQIPSGTAFVLTGVATDVDADPLTYAWEQIDDGVVVTATFGPNNVSGANFRSLPPTSSPERYFPRLSRIVAGTLEQENPGINEAWETVANVGRDLNFALTVRDNNPEGGQITSDSLVVTVLDNAGPFRVSSQSAGEVYEAGSVQTVSWDVAGTNAAPINEASVDIYLSTDGGSTFNTPLATNVPNTGSASVQIPGIATTNARVMVKASNSIFLAVNSAPFTIAETSAILSVTPLTFSACKPDDVNIPITYESFNGFSETMTFSINASQPFTAAFSPTTATTNGTAVALTLGNTAAIPAGTHTVEVLATGATFTASVTLEVQLFDAALDPVVLAFPEDAAIGTEVNPNLTWQGTPNFSSYDIEIATDATFTTLVETATVNFPNYQTTQLQAETEYFWRVRPKNLCGDGTFGTPFSFTTSVVNCASFESADVPIAISPVGTPTIRATRFLAEDLTISDLNVQLEIAHTFLEDLTVTLIGPSGTRVTLLSRNCGNLNNIVAVFDDAGTPLSCSGNPAISGTVQPLGSLAAFNGESTLGEWVLEISDGAASDGGSLDAFSLEFCVEGTFRPDEDEDGVFDDGDDLCLGTPKGVLVDTSGCPLNSFPENNFTIALQSESCIAASDGAIEITAADETIDYSATLSGNGVSSTQAFTNQLTFSNLPGGTYQLCINGTQGTTTFRESCFDVLINEPEALSVLANLLTDGATVLLQMSGGQIYTIENNGVAEQTMESEVRLALNPGLNTVRVFTGLSCQGVFEQQFFVADRPILAPNPATSIVQVSSRFQNERVQVLIYSAAGRLVATRYMNVEGFTFDLDVSNLANGVYYIRIQANGTTQTSKLIKR